MGATHGLLGPLATLRIVHRRRQGDTATAVSPCILTYQQLTMFAQSPGAVVLQMAGRFEVSPLLRTVMVVTQIGALIGQSVSLAQGVVHPTPLVTSPHLVVPSTREKQKLQFAGHVAAHVVHRPPSQAGVGPVPHWHGSAPPHPVLTGPQTLPRLAHDVRQHVPA